MARNGGESAALVEVIPATRADLPIVGNLMELYIHDFSEFLAVVPGPDGRFGYPNLSLFWSEADRFPFLIRVGGDLGGFALIAQVHDPADGEPVWDVVEFFVLRGLRRRGVGAEAARQIWRRFPGRWQVRVMPSNRAAIHFWKQAIAAVGWETIASTLITEDGRPWHVFSFDSPLVA
jgi:predicted acetyltransferase